MASSSNGNGNLVDEFEEAFQICLQALTKQESSSGIDKDEIKLEVDQTTMKFIDLARQMEAFFLQKRFLLSSLKPELLVKEDNQDLKHEIGRKEELIRKHYDKIDQWKALLADQQTNYKHQPQSIQQDIRGVVGGPPNNSTMPQSVNPQMPMSGMGNPMQAHLQAQHMQQQQQQMLQAQQLQQMQQMQVGAQQQQMFIQQQHQQQLGQQQQQVGMTALNQRQGNPTSMVSAVGSGLVGGNGVNTVGGLQGNFNQSGNILQGPLAYLEKTTSNIDLVGMGDGRR